MTSYTTTTMHLSADGQTRERVTFCTSGGYVTYTDRDGHDRQICHRLQTMGETLRSSEAGLRRTIQRHMRMARYDAQREY